MSKTRACYNCLYHTQSTQLNSGSQPRCKRGLNPALEDAPPLYVRWKGEFAADEMASFCDSYLWAPEAYAKLRRVARAHLAKDPRWSTSKLPEKFVQYYERNDRVRIKVETISGSISTECGYVSLSTGWIPFFLLMRSTRARGSSILLRDDMRVVAVKEGDKGRYKPV